jgi:hypothetical protein
MSFEQMQTTTAPVNTEAAPVEAPKKPEVDFDSRFAALARKEKALVERERNYKGQFEKTKTELSEYEEYKKFLATPNDSPDRLMKTLEKAGYTWEKAIEIASNMPQTTQDSEVLTLKQKIAAMEKREADKEKAALEKETEAKDSAIVKEHKTAIKEHISTDADKYEFVTAYGQEGIDQVFEVIEAYWDENEEILSIDKAAEFVENYLEQEASKFKGLKKVAKLFNPSEKDVQDRINSPKDSGETSKTLTNNSVIASSNDDLSGLSHEEKIKILAARYQK